MKILMHMCCAPCANAPIAALREEGIGVTGLWYNPNIHPFTEYRSRKNTVIDYAKMVNLPLIMMDEYGLREFVQAVAADIDGRCDHCYRCRLEVAAMQAAEGGFDGFTTSLLISPYQNHEKLIAVGQEMAARHGVDFFYRDFRPLFRPGQAQAREMEMYMQKYCGCVFSEEERYRKKKKPAKGAPL